MGGLTVEDPDQKIYASDISNGHTLVRKGKQGVLILVLK
jgi:hypothetical protein